MEMKMAQPTVARLHDASTERPRATEPHEGLGAAMLRDDGNNGEVVCWIRRGVGTRHSRFHQIREVLGFGISYLQ